MDINTNNYIISTTKHMQALSNFLFWVKSHQQKNHLNISKLNNYLCHLGSSKEKFVKHLMIKVYNYCNLNSFLILIELQKDVVWIFL